MTTDFAAQTPFPPNDGPIHIEPGDVRHYRGQKYTCEGVVPYRRRDGSDTTLAVMSSACFTCGVVFEFSIPASISKFEPNRRCILHHRPGRRVRQKRKQATKPPALS